MKKTSLNSINLFSLMPERLKDFYQQVFGLVADPKRSHALGFFLLEGNTGCNILLQQADEAGGAVGHLGFELGFEVESLDGLAELALKHGGTIINSGQQMGWGEAITVADPEGHAINVYVFRKPDH